MFFNSKIYIVDRKAGVINLKTASRITVEHAVVLTAIKLGILFGERADDKNSIINYDSQLGIKIVILPKSNRKSKKKFDSDLYCLRYVVENTFLKFKVDITLLPLF